MNSRSPTPASASPPIKSSSSWPPCGASSKRDELARSRRTYIGQFGIGLLSCFLIADEITVISRSADGSAPIEWIGDGDGDLRLRPISDDVAVRRRPARPRRA